MRIEKPLTQEELKAGDLIKPGIYDFEVVAAEDAISKAGNEQIKLQLKVWTDNGRERFVFDYLLAAMEFKVGHFAETTGLIKEYQAGTLEASDCYGKSGKCKIYTSKDKTGEFGDKSAVADYIPGDEVFAKKTQEKVNSSKQKNDDFLDDPLPF